MDRIDEWKRMGGEVRSIKGVPTKTEQIVAHLREHTEYPTSSRRIVAACSNLACLDFEDDRRWLEENLETRVFRNSGEAERSLGLR